MLRLWEIIDQESILLRVILDVQVADIVPRGRVRGHFRDYSLERAIHHQAKTARRDNTVHESDAAMERGWELVKLDISFVDDSRFTDCRARIEIILIFKCITTAPSLEKII